MEIASYRKKIRNITANTANPSIAEPAARNQLAP